MYVYVYMCTCIMHKRSVSKEGSFRGRSREERGQQRDKSEANNAPPLFVDVP